MNPQFQQLFHFPCLIPNVHPDDDRIIIITNTIVSFLNNYENLNK